MSGDVSDNASLAAEIDPLNEDANEVPALAVLAVHFQEILAVILWTLAADVLIFRSLGYSGPAVFFALVPIIFCVNRFRNRSAEVGPTEASGHRLAIAVLSGLLLCVAMRLLWLGSAMTVCSGAVLVVGLAMAASGVMPFVLEGIAFASRLLFDGLVRLRQYRLPRRGGNPSGDHQSEVAAGTSARSPWTWLLPIILGTIFASLFVMANPDLRGMVGEQFSKTWKRILTWASMTSPWELPFCVLALVIGAGLMRPRSGFTQFGKEEVIEAEPNGTTASLLPAFRNTLILLIGLFCVYLSFEFSTLWRSEFPEGFYYAGYAHQGAAWLTIALAVATVLLSVIFSGEVLQDSRVNRLRTLAWVWSVLNLLLAMAVYNRLLIYVGYNGMTRMRTVGFFGITVVVIGFLLVLYKIAKHRSFWWLVRAQLIALVLTIVSYSLFPVDYVAHRYNAAKVATGYLHPSVMIAVKPIDNEGMLNLFRLVDHPDPIIREGVKARLANRLEEIRKQRNRNPNHWTAFQAAENRLLKKLEAHKSVLQPYLGKPNARNDAGAVFTDYAMQWY
ncbi:hypothetical protein Q31b_12500 [Novipirellula aureliae]|uniref:Uncharacterized protein n=1 Tax=Novipirellula aureliae TaxID=2527966 RepID=A0A5C6E7S3_9BACT|nr:DUF4153 domain-containing protein [Novipirellula aureliae]TWU43721.1 hypothetical protein Q31b_12500 [Novipirellula aureliae]